ncbi:MAG: M48 family metalloprotease [Candidatus Adiutrix sp.]|jgi:Zn-dependent protease with chaperone function|nr:M48 family metalloprotease [Candidatus Adiutrix sp.]
MNPDIFGRQEATRGKGYWFVVVFAFTTLAAILIIYAMVAMVIIASARYIPVLLAFTPLMNALSNLSFFSDESTIFSLKPFLFIGLPVAATVLIVSIKERLAIINGGGAYVAQQLGGVLLDAEPAEPGERMLADIIDEMSADLGLPRPLLYVLPRESGINAMTAGLTPDDAVIIVTRGALDMLDRDELRGVAAHEFGHIVSGDCAMNCQMASCLAGLMFIAVSGQQLINRSGDLTSALSPFKSAFFYAAGAVIYISGLVGKWMAELVQAAFSRQREFQADAFADQYAHSPEGLTRALKKIGGFRRKGVIGSGRALLLRPFFIASPTKFSGLFHSHPRLESRISALLPQWDGQFTPIEYIPQMSEEKRKALLERLDAFGLVRESLNSLKPHKKLPDITTDWRGGLALSMLAAAGDVPPPQNMAEAAGPALPPEAALAALDPDQAAALASAVILYETPLTAQDIPPLSLTARAVQYRWLVTAENRLPLLDLAVPTLRKAPPCVRLEVRDIMERCLVIRENSSFSDVAAAWALMELFPEMTAGLNCLDNELNYFSLIRDAAVTALSVMAWQSAGGEGGPDLFRDKASNNFNHWAAPEIRPREEAAPFIFHQALSILRLAPRPVKSALQAAAAEMAAETLTVTQTEYEYLRALNAAVSA